VTAADQLLERGADRLEALAARAAAADGVTQKAAEPLADDAEFLRKLRPSLIRARLRGEAPKDERPAHAEVPRPDVGPPKKKRRGGGGPNPFLVAAVALAVGVAAAKWIDWKGHGHPRG
jgi:hypothetical protein